jgi:hypothetical protein
MTEHCRSCGAIIIWAKTKNGNAMPVDAIPVPDGNIDLLSRGDWFLASVLNTAQIAALKLQEHREGYEHKLWKSHFATCPTANFWRKQP